MIAIMSILLFRNFVKKMYVFLSCVIYLLIVLKDIGKRC